MTTTPGPGDDSDQPAARWSGRASVGSSQTPGSPGDPAAGPPVVGRASVDAYRASSAPVSPPQESSPAIPPVTPVYRTRKRLRPRWGRIALVTAIVIGLVASGFVLWGYLFVQHVNDNIKRTESLDQMAGPNRPPKTVDGAINILLLGSDSRNPDEPINVGGNWRTDTIELMHIPASHDKAYLISIPRDTWVYVPKSTTSQYGDTMAKINAATAWGGVPLMVRTVEAFTGVHIDHLALIDFAGFVKVVDALGGVDMYIDQTITSIHPPHRTFHKGMNHLNGAEALDYVRQRYQFADGDFSRIRHQQAFLKAVLDKAASAGTVANLGKLTSFVNSVADAITVDKDFSVLDMAWQFHSLRSSDMTFMTCPNQGTANEDGQSVVLSDKTKALSLFDAVNKDTVGQWLAQPGNAPK
jgi:LCP family protein required for cell wall assembly